MSVYVDPLRLYRGRQWSHLIADDVQELHEFAAGLGLKRAWFQDDERHPHYDIGPRLRERAIDMGALPVASREVVTILRAYSTRLDKS